MKRCPECRRDYYDDSLSYCLDDGTALLEGPSSVDDPATAILPGSAVNYSDPVTRPLLHTTAAEAERATDISGETAHRSASSQGKRGRIVAAAALAILISAGGFFGYRYLASPKTGEIRSIAVLPFQNRNSDADTEYLSDGLAESLIYRLSQIPELKVSPRSSVFRYK